MAKCVTTSVQIRQFLDSIRIPYTLEVIGLLHSRAVFEVELDDFVRIYTSTVNAGVVIKFVGCHTFELVDLGKASHEYREF